jgi:hypothetical protein
LTTLTEGMMFGDLGFLMRKQRVPHRH